eukprot:6282050-Lingulodinium_polyedra.AAC.1
MYKSKLGLFWGTTKVPTSRFGGTRAARHDLMPSVAFGAPCFFGRKKEEQGEKEQPLQQQQHANTSCSH